MHGSPWLYICPLKMEVISENPFIVQIYEVVNDKNADRAIKKAENYIQRNNHDTSKFLESPEENILTIRIK